MGLEFAVYIIVYLIVAGLIFGLLWWMVNHVPLFEPFRMVAQSILIVLAVLVAIGFLLICLRQMPLLR